MQVISETIIGSALNYNETEVRFHIIDPIVRTLGYPDSEDVYLNLEEKLEYPYIHIGRRSKKDVPLGFPDYRAGIEGARGSFVIEAKAGNVSINAKEVEQAHSYAAHAQVGANYFVLCNGTKIAVFETLSGSDASALVEIPIAEVNQRFYELENILAPSSLAKNCQITHDMKLKLTDGLGSSVRFRSGQYLLSECEYRILMNGQDCTNILRQSVPQIATIDEQLELLKTAFKLRVSGGFAERNDDGRIIAHVEFEGATTHNHQAMSLMGITEATFATSDEFISTSCEYPSMFESFKGFTVSKGTIVPGFFGGASEMEDDLEGNLFIRAGMTYYEGGIRGQFIALSEQEISVSGSIPLRIEMKMSGTFEIILDE